MSKWLEEYEDFQEFHFHIVDYIIFCGMLIVSAGTGIYYGYYKKNTIIEHIDPKCRRGSGLSFGSKKLSEYLLGSRSLATFPVAMSLIGSYVSGVTVLGTPAEIYNFGTQYWLTVIPVMLMALTVSTVYLPVFTTLRICSSYEYLELRFSSGIRSFASFLFIIDEILFLPIILYVPAIAFNQVTGLNIHLISGIVCVVCVFYTLLGGIKAVVSTDAWQILVMFISVTVVVIIGTTYIGGPSEVIKRSLEGGRIRFSNFNPSLYERHSVWSVVVGGYFYWVSFNSVNQTMVQRYMSLPTKKSAQVSIVLFAIGICLFVSICCFAGLLIFAYYSKCDPLTAGLIQTDDQLFPVYVMQIAGHITGIPGLFVAGIFGACLSSLSVVLNCTSAVLLEDIVKGCFKIHLSEKASHFLVKTSVVVFGVIATLLVVVLEKLGGILAVATSLSSIAAGTTSGIFTLGMLIPWSNTKGATFGALAGALISGTVSLGSQVFTAEGLLVPQKLQVWVDECPAFLNITAPSTDVPDQSELFPLFRISFLWVGPIGMLTVLFVGTIVSFLTGPTKVSKLDADLLSPVIHRFLPKECFINQTVEVNTSLT
ncbi:sodium-coupled monocarboxylate transporter 2-like isoform X2 [Eupeodes corollae]|uniref:sodium-coupled monocarboxylate transporter 2-like isoform X2 n=1 Tax=Eupeodes corollae TaxID=290404 RepID=UPI002493CD9B|nr:sodium-coupled monocarboxylate transporter 2-like isoform X2 [Eupeodes corollae]